MPSRCKRKIHEKRAQKLRKKPVANMTEDEVDELWDYEWHGLVREASEVLSNFEMPPCTEEQALTALQLMHNRLTDVEITWRLKNGRTVIAKWQPHRDNHRLENMVVKLIIPMMIANGSMRMSEDSESMPDAPREEGGNLLGNPEDGLSGASEPTVGLGADVADSASARVEAGVAMEGK